MTNNKFIITLADFQGHKLELQKEDFIYYLRNPNFFLRWNNIFNPTIDIKLYFYFKRILSKFLESPILKNNIFFLGYRSKSINSKRDIYELLQSSKKINEQDIIIVIGKGDYEITDEFADDIPDNIKFIYANNINTKNPKYRYLPMGRDFRSSSLFTQVKASYKKEYLCYCNFSINTHPQRKELFNSIKDKHFIDFEHMGKFLDYSISRRDYFNKVSKSKFTISPRGNGIDTFRLWDSIYLGAIPIIVKEAVFHEYLYDLPILFLDSYDDFINLNEDFLEETYHMMLKKKYNYEKLFFSYWIDMIETS